MQEVRMVFVGCTRATDAAPPFAVSKGGYKRALSESGASVGGAGRDRTGDLIVANDALSQLSYSPTRDDTGILSFARHVTGSRRKRCKPLFPGYSARPISRPSCMCCGHLFAL